MNLCKINGVNIRQHKSNVFKVLFYLLFSTDDETYHLIIRDDLDQGGKGRRGREAGKFVFRNFFLLD